MTDSGVSDTPAPSAPAAPDEPHRVSRTVTIVVALVAVVVGLVVGGLIGWKVEQNRVKDDVKAKAESVRQNTRPFGTVTAVTPTSVTVKLSTGAPGSRTFTISDATTVDRALGATKRAITRGSKVLVAVGSGGGSNPQAAEIIVLPKSTGLGQGG